MPRRTANRRRSDLVTVIPRLESIGQNIIEHLQGLKRNQLKQQLLTMCHSNTTLSSGTSLCPIRRSLKQVLDELNLIEEQRQRQSRSIAVSGNSIDTVQSTNNETAKFNEETSRWPRVKRAKATLPTPVTRTICTRSSKLNAANNNEEPMSQEIPRRTSSSVVEDMNQRSEPPRAEQQKSIGEDVSGVKVSRKKIQLSTTTNSTVSSFLNDF